MERLRTAGPSSRRDYSYSASARSYAPASPAPASGYERGLAYLKAERYADAVEALERFVSRNPDDQRAKQAFEQAQREQSSKSEKLYKDGLVAYTEGNTADCL
jgi:tetratricopeptide (TPR) repeat protein